MTLNEIVENAGYEAERFLEETTLGEKIIKASHRFNISNWEKETGDQVGVSFQLLKAVADGLPFDRLYWSTKISPKRKHCFADAQNIYAAAKEI